MEVNSVYSSIYVTDSFQKEGMKVPASKNEKRKKKKEKKTSPQLHT